MKLLKTSIALAISLVLVSCKDSEIVNSVTDTFAPGYMVGIDPANFININGS